MREKESMKRISGITYLKAFLPLLVIACHIRPFGDSSFMSFPFPKFPDYKDVFYINICSLAVPLFLLVSFFLYLKKRERTENRFKLCVSRVLYFFGIFVFVRIIYYFFGIGNIWIADRGLFKNTYALVFGGGDTLLYYLEISIYLLVFLEIYYLILEKSGANKNLFNIIGFCFGLLLISALYFVPNDTIKTEFLRFYSPVCFVHYVFGASYIYENRDNLKNIILYSLLIVGSGFAVFEWAFLPDPLLLKTGFSLALSLYGRVSVIFVTLALFGLCLKIKKSPTRFTEYLATLSLYVYCIHQIIINFVSPYVRDYPFIAYCIVVVITYIFSAFISFVIKTLKPHFKLKKT